MRDFARPACFVLPPRFLPQVFNDRPRSNILRRVPRDPRESSPDAGLYLLRLTRSIALTRHRPVQTPCTRNFILGDYSGPPKGLTKSCWASSSRRTQAGTLTHTAHPISVYIPALWWSPDWSPDYTWWSELVT